MRITNNETGPLQGNSFLKGAGIGEDQSASFADVLRDAVQEVNNLQHGADRANMALVQGQVDDLHQVILAGEKAGIALQLTVQIRNKVVEAYQELMRMQV